ncbi:hypothetical protein CLAFUW4_05649 [Fulvia fulva]|uniref:Uncharacterized protein n=1 Tax=Passalora fulva TaxID=5499 RepID=A0A9Q8LI49_PASFU|nr:uncharacterized protein CLAFUR5_05790 [Fulvia fulva]KAK4623765.1 hypothetical protein CLAFUR4_05644 [Fulvia fulva]KAK4625111.1 hypothetical protein CLAFUR0_05652 [Fulvia fulva]UJO17902.1 hypothetical protein CLAFUR5_05790 [Fulvia fulva]WPV15436.1 hypothetical protein CLAFUW4_05649 [Fulvia fulva]WPV29780.1 hypothetical protein CLAFUW7_05648 [Fulvia fulva]
MPLQKRGTSLQYNNSATMFSAYNGPVKTYQVVNTKAFNTRHLQIRHNNRPLLWAETKRSFFSAPQTNLHKGSMNGPVVAAVKLRTMSSSFLVAYGDAVGRDLWEKVQSGIFSNKQYGFMLQGRHFCWRRTHDKFLGASRMGSQDFKLLDAANDKVLAAYMNQNWSMSSGDGRIDWYVELGQALEIMAIPVLLGLEMRIRAAHAAGAAGAGEGGGGGGGG